MSFATAACEVWVVQPKVAGDVSSGKAAASGRVEVMRKRIARQEVRLAWGHDCAVILGSDSAGPTSHSVGAEMQTESHHVPAVGAFGVPSNSKCRFRDSLCTRIQCTWDPLAYLPERNCASSLHQGSIHLTSHHFGSAAKPQLCPQRSVHSGSEGVGAHVQKGC